MVGGRIILLCPWPRMPVVFLPHEMMLPEQVRTNVASTPP